MLTETEKAAYYMSGRIHALIAIIETCPKMSKQEILDYLKKVSDDFAKGKIL